MNAVCSNCPTVTQVRLQRGSALAQHTCPECGHPLKSPIAGQARGRYLCPVDERIVTLGMTGAAIEEPMRLVWRIGYIGEHLHDTPSDSDARRLQRLADRVLGPGCVVSETYLRSKPADAQASPGLLLIPAEEPGDAAHWIVNEAASYRACAACGTRTVDVPCNRSDAPWLAARKTASRGRGKPSIAVDQGPHPAGSVGCRRCRPA